MKRFLTSIIFAGFVYFACGQQLANLPIPIGAGNAEVWNEAIYLFGGSNNWSGSIVYPRIYKFDGTAWGYFDSIPDNNLWDVETILVGDNVYLLGGWPSGPSFNRKYNLSTGVWTYLSESPNTYQTWGITSEELDGNIYLFNSYGETYAYNIATDTWSSKTFNTATGTWDLSSILFHGDVYILGWDNSAFYKYSPAGDQWTQLADSPYQVGACAFGIINDLIYCVGGNDNGSSAATYQSIIVYDITTNSWATDTLEISSKRHWMATAEYKGGLYVVGGIDEYSGAVDIVEEIVPQGTAGIGESGELKGFSLEQNYPNPFTHKSLIKFTIPETSFVSLEIFDLLGDQKAALVNSRMTAGKHEVNFDASGLPQGVYYYRLMAGRFVQTKKLVVQ